MLAAYSVLSTSHIYCFAISMVDWDCLYIFGDAEAGRVQEPCLLYGVRGYEIFGLPWKYSKPCLLLALTCLDLFIGLIWL